LTAQILVLGWLLSLLVMKWYIIAA
jgi:hypothetical protein